MEHAPSEDSKREAERLLARKVAKMKAAESLAPAALEELEALEASHRRSEELSFLIVGEALVVPHVP